MSELKNIVEYLKEKNAYGEVKGRKMWVDFARTNVSYKIRKYVFHNFLLIGFIVYLFIYILFTIIEFAIEWKHQVKNFVLCM